MHLSSASHQMIILSCLLLLLSAFTSGVISHDPKKPTCCQKLTEKPPTTKITKCYILPQKGKCLQSVVFIDIMDKMHCIDPKASWLERRLERLEKNGVKCKDYTKS